MANGLQTDTQEKITYNLNSSENHNGCMIGNEDINLDWQYSFE